MTQTAETFRALHRPSDPLLMVNVWDRGTARMMANLGAMALATSSAAHAFTLGEPDGVAIDRDAALGHAQDILGATRLPVQGDFENGFGDDPDTCAETVRLSAEVGLAGICIEDTVLPGDGFYDFDLAVDRIRAAAAAARALPPDFVLTAGADGMLTGRYDTDEAIRRLQAFEQAGADCLYAPLPPDMAALQRIVGSVNTPVNVLIAGDFTGVAYADFARIGVARLSQGSSLARVYHGAVLNAARAMFQGDYRALAQGAGSATVDPLLAEPIAP